MRPVRPALIAAAAAAVVLAAAGTALWVQRGLWSEGAVHYLRQRLAADLGAEFHADGPRVRWLPPRLSLGRVTLHRPGEPWVLEAEDLRVSLNLYAVIFGRERLGRVVVVRPRLFVRGRSGGGARDGARAGTAPEAGSDLLRLPLPFRYLEVVDGRLDYRDPSGRLAVVEGVDLLLEVSRGEARGRLLARRVAAEAGGRRLELGTLTAGAALVGGRVAVRDLALEGGAVPLRLSGTVGADGSLALEGTATARLDLSSGLAGPPAAGGTAHLAGTIGGSWPAPVASGRIELREPALRGRPLPEMAGDFTLSRGRLALAGELGGGTFSLALEATGAGDATAWRLAGSLRDVLPSRLPLPAGSPLRRAGPVSGRAEASGVGVSWPRLAARASFAVHGGVPGWEGEVEAAGELSASGGAVRLEALRAAAGGVEVAGEGTWSRAAGLAVTVRGSVADLGAIARAAPGPLGGRARFSGTVTAGAGDPAFAGTVEVEEGSLGPLAGVRAAARAVVTPRGVTLAGGTFGWEGGGRGALAGRLGLPGGELDLAASVAGLGVGEAARLLGADAGDAAGSLDATAAIRGTLRAPAVEARVRGGPLRAAGVGLDRLSAALAWDGRRLEVRELRAARGGSTALASGTVEAGRIVGGRFEAPALALRDLLPGARVGVTGRAEGTVEGPLRAPEVRAALAGVRIHAGALDLPAGDLAVEAAAGVVAVRGWVGAPENRLRAVLEPAFGWRFEADLRLDRLSTGTLFPAGRPQPRGLARAGFLTSGTLRASGRLRDAASISAEAALDSLWFEGAGRTLQNTAPVRLAWRDGVLRVEDFELAGDQYRLRIGGSAGPGPGWALTAEGRVSLGLFQEYWDELLEVEGSADVRLALAGPWLAPEPAGTITVLDGFVRARSLPEPLEGASGRVELHGRSIVATEVAARIAGSPFRGRGSYDLAEDRLDAEVEGRLDLALFRSRVPAARELRGPVDVRLRLAGPIAAPRFSGAVEVLGAELSLRPFPSPITAVRGRLSIGAESVEVRELTGQTGSGSLRLAGAVSWGPASRRVDLELAARDVLLSLAGVAKVQADLDLGLHGPFDDLALRGEVTVLKGRYLLEFGEKPPRLAGGEPQGPPERGAPDLGRMALDVRVRAADNVWVANSTAKIEAAIAVDIGGTVDEPVLGGEVNAIHGEAYYLSRFFRLESAVLRFTPPARVPVLDLQASTAVGETQVLFLMGGPLDDLAFHLTSLPPLSQEDLISLLTVGQTRANLERRGDQASAMGAAVFSSEPIVNALGDTARSSLGLEVLQLEPIVGEDSQVSARLTLGTHLSDRLFVSYTQNLGETEDQQFRVEYSILDYLALWGRQMRQGIYSLDLVFRYAFR